MGWAPRLDKEETLSGGPAVVRFSACVQPLHAPATMPHPPWWTAPTMIDFPGTGGPFQVLTITLQWLMLTKAGVLRGLSSFPFKLQSWAATMGLVLLRPEERVRALWSGVTDDCELYRWVCGAGSHDWDLHKSSKSSWPLGLLGSLHLSLTKDHLNAESWICPSLC